MNNDFYVKNLFSRFIEIRGVDSAEFLQGIITNDIYKCKKMGPIYSCLLTPQGKFLADFFIIALLDCYLIEIHEKFFSSFLSYMKIYKLRSDVNFTINEKISSIILFANQDHKFEDTIINFKDPRNKYIGEKILINNKKAFELNNLDEVDFDKYREILIKNYVPFAPDDLEIKKSLLLENNFENLNAIDWQKGCYVGQEITARMKYRALLKKRIYILEIVSGEINIGEEIILNNVSLGKVINKVNKYILCMLKIELVKKNKKKNQYLQVNDFTNLKFL
tara:strand:+ start:38054 stop:38887 length:834 start_codon:yes stop_codon:yes gene_type:complete